MDEQISKQYRYLGVGIVSQAIKDYKAALIAYKKAENFVNEKTRAVALNNARHEILKLERFFKGPWCSTLVDCDMNTVIRKVRSLEGIDEYETFEEE